MIAFGDKEIAVRIRGNSHYRNFVYAVNDQVGMLIVLRPIKVSWANWGRCGDAADEQTAVPFSRPNGRALLFYPLSGK